MSQEKPQRPTTYGDMFTVEAELRERPITREDVGTLEREENKAYGAIKRPLHTSVMQSAADGNVRVSNLPTDAHTPTAEEGMGIAQKTEEDGSRKDVAIVGGQAVGDYSRIRTRDNDRSRGEREYRGADEGGRRDNQARAKKSEFAKPDAIEVAGRHLNERPVGEKEANVIRSAERAAAGMMADRPGGVAATAQAAKNRETTVCEILEGAKEKLPTDHMVGKEDAARVMSAERRNDPDNVVEKGGIAASVQGAYAYNEGR